MRDLEEVLHAMGLCKAMEGVKSYYPAFNITPLNLVGVVVTVKGVSSAYDFKRIWIDAHSE